MTPTALATQETVQWTDKYLLGYVPMDEIHQEFVHIVGQMQLAEDAQLPTLLVSLEAHAKSHFEMENSWMRETNFPPRECHIDEHAAVLSSIEDVKTLVTKGDYAVVQAIGQRIGKMVSSPCGPS